jgi:hypothetical protein
MRRASCVAVTGRGGVVRSMHERICPAHPLLSSPRASHAASPAPPPDTTAGPSTPRRTTPSRPGPADHGAVCAPILSYGVS